MANYKILVPSGIGDFSWLWSKLVTTEHNFHIRYVGGLPDRLQAFMKLLPSSRILSYGPDLDYCTFWDEHGFLQCRPRDLKQTPPLRRAESLADLYEDEMVFIENNSWLEAGNRIEGWMAKDIPGTCFHYALEGADEQFARGRGNYFIVNFSSYGTKKAWGYYEVPIAAGLVRRIAAKTGAMPFFIGGGYDDFTRDIYDSLRDSLSCVSLIGRTPSLREVIALLQQSRFYFGACSGLMVLTNIVNVPVITYYPPFEKPPGRKLSGTWHDPAIPHLGLFWEGAESDMEQIEAFLKGASV